jgi:hypothetical protein
MQNNRFEQKNSEFITNFYSKKLKDNFGTNFLFNKPIKYMFY